MKKKWIFDIYNGKSEFIEQIFVIASDNEEAGEALAAYFKGKQDCWANGVGEEQISDEDPSSDVRF